MPSRARTIRWSAAFVFLAACGVVVALGPLDPPAGPVAPTYKTLNEVEPRIAINATNTPGDADSLFRITQRGSYYLTGNVTGVTGKHGIEVAASGVTIDLNGFDVVGVAGSLDGVNANGVSLNDLSVLNGSIRSWGGNGVHTASPAVINCRLVGLRVSGCAGSGIIVGPDTEVTRCTVTQNTLGGINTGIAATVSGCTAYSNGDTGIFANSGSTIVDCTSSSNAGNGISTAQGCIVSRCAANSNAELGVTGLNGCTIVDCSARSNTGDGIRVATTCLVRSNTCSANGSGAGDGAGIHATGADNRIEGNVCNSADRGVDVDVGGNFVSRNTCSGNTTNWSLVAGNVCLVVNATLAAAISGNSGGTAPGSTDPNANFTY